MYIYETDLRLQQQVYVLSWEVNAKHLTVKEYEFFLWLLIWNIIGDLSLNIGCTKRWKNYKIKWVKMLKMSRSQKTDFTNWNLISVPSSFAPDDYILKKEWNTKEALAKTVTWALSRNQQFSQTRTTVCAIFHSSNKEADNNTLQNISK